MGHSAYLDYVDISDFVLLVAHQQTKRGKDLLQLLHKRRVTYLVSAGVCVCVRGGRGRRREEWNRIGERV